MSEVRYDLITGKIAIISTERSKRPHDFKIVHAEKKNTLCPFCPGNEELTPPTLIEYKDEDGMWKLRGFSNKFAALNKDTDDVLDSFYNSEYGYGVAEIIVESPDHDATLGKLSIEQIKDIFSALKVRYNKISEDKKIKYVQMFKNFGARGGASLEHGHWQIIATSFIPDFIEKEVMGTQKYIKQNGNCPYCDIIKHEQTEKIRIVSENEDFIAICPYASQYAYEVMILPKKHCEHFKDIDSKSLKSLANIFKPIIEKYEDEFNMPPYNVVISTLPVNDDRNYHWHMSIYPRLTIAAGFELATGVYINPVSPEMATTVLKID
ncbi:MAG: galactose-1-phosphate uridylyltransferase [Thermoanaerobacteraceae bacterium]